MVHTRQRWRGERVGEKGGEKGGERDVERGGKIEK
jgi:hypothetical protein